MTDISEDRFQGLAASKRMFFGDHQSWYNKFKRVLMAMDGANWRNRALFIKTVKALAKKNCMGATDKHVRKLSVFWESFNRSCVTIRPMILDPSNLGVFATRTITAGTVVNGPSGRITVKSTCVNSLWKTDKPILKKTIGINLDTDFLTL